MIEIQRILCPIDFSLASRRALDHAAVLAGWYGSRVTVLHVYDPQLLPEPPVLFAEGARRPDPAETDSQAAEVQLLEWIAPLRAKGIGVDVAFEQSHNAAQRILQVARALPADALVLGSHGRSGFERLLLGSVTEKILRKAACPVLTVPPPAIHATRLPFKHLLCPVDFFEPSLAAVEFAFSIAKESDAQVVLLHAIEWPVDDETIVDRAVDVSQYRHRVEGEAHRRLSALVPSDARWWCDPSIKVAWGKPYRCILETAGADAADLIVMGVHGRGAIDVALFGSTTNQTVRRAPCPVLTLKR